MPISPKTFTRRLNLHFAATGKVIVKSRDKELARGDYVLLDTATGNKRYLSLADVQSMARKLETKSN